MHWGCSACPKEFRSRASSIAHIGTHINYGSEAPHIVPIYPPAKPEVVKSIDVSESSDRKRRRKPDLVYHSSEYYLEDSDQGDDDDDNNNDDDDKEQVFEVCIVDDNDAKLKKVKAVVEAPSISTANVSNKRSSRRKAAKPESKSWSNIYDKQLSRISNLLKRQKQNLLKTDLVNKDKNLDENPNIKPVALEDDDNDNQLITKVKTEKPYLEDELQLKDDQTENFLLDTAVSNVQFGYMGNSCFDDTQEECYFLPPNRCDENDRSANCDSLLSESNSTKDNSNYSPNCPGNMFDFDFDTEVKSPIYDLIPTNESPKSQSEESHFTEENSPIKVKESSKCYKRERKHDQTLDRRISISSLNATGIPSVSGSNQNAGDENKIIKAESNQISLIGLKSDVSNDCESTGFTKEIANSTDIKQEESFNKNIDKKDNLYEVSSINRHMNSSVSQRTLKDLSTLNKEITNKCLASATKFKDYDELKSDLMRTINALESNDSSSSKCLKELSEKQVCQNSLLPNSQSNNLIEYSNINFNKCHLSSNSSLKSKPILNRSKLTNSHNSFSERKTEKINNLKMITDKISERILEENLDKKTTDSNLRETSVTGEQSTSKSSNVV